jgi:hypothetical protein
MLIGRACGGCGFRTVHLSDMVNRTRAADAAVTLALAVLNREELSAQAA